MQFQRNRDVGRPAVFQDNTPISCAFDELTLTFVNELNNYDPATAIPLRVSDTVQATPDQGICGLPPKAFNLHAVNFHPKVDMYTMNFSVKTVKSQH